MNYTETKKLDEESAKKMKEGTGPVDECICSLLSPPDAERKSIASSIKKALASITTGIPGKKRTESNRMPSMGRDEGFPSKKTMQREGSAKKKRILLGPGGVDIPILYSKEEQGNTPGEV